LASHASQTTLQMRWLYLCRSTHCAKKVSMDPMPLNLSGFIHFIHGCGMVAGP